MIWKRPGRRGDTSAARGLPLGDWRQFETELECLALEMGLFAFLLLLLLLFENTGVGRFAGV